MLVGYGEARTDWRGLGDSTSLRLFFGFMVGEMCVLETLGLGNSLTVGGFGGSGS